MRHLRFLSLVVGASALAACEKAEVTSSTRPPLAGVRFINALPDTGAVDIRAIDQIEWSPVANALAFRSGTQYMPTQAGSRHFRMFPTDSIASVTSQFMKDTSITFEANKNYTIIAAGLARSKNVRLIVIQDAVPSIPAGQIALRTINATSSAVNMFLTTAATDPLPATSQSSVDFTPSAYAMRPAGAVVARFQASGATTAAVSATGPSAPSNPTGTVLPAAGVNVGGSAFSVIYFPASVTGSRAPQTAAFQSPAAVFFVDQVPTTP